MESNNSRSRSRSREIANKAAKSALALGLAGVATAGIGRNIAAEVEVTDLRESMGLAKTIDDFVDIGTKTVDTTTILGRQLGVESRVRYVLEVDPLHPLKPSDDTDTIDFGSPYYRFRLANELLDTDQDPATWRPPQNITDIAYIRAGDGLLGIIAALGLAAMAMIKSQSKISDER